MYISNSNLKYAMSVFVLRNFGKISFNSCCYLPTSSKLLIRNGAVASIPKRILKSQQLLSNCVLHRYSSTSIKPYKSNRKYPTNWKLERLMGWSMIILIPSAFAIDSKELEMVLSFVALLHTYWGCQSMCSDYLRSSVVGKLLPIVARLSVVLLFLTSTLGAYQLIYEDIGLINMIKKFWSIRGRDYVLRKHMYC